MARCELGYLCVVCGEEVEDLVDSGLYLRFILGEIDPETLHLADECHLRCNPAVSQFIVDDGFGSAEAPGLFAKSALDPAFVAEEEARITNAYRRLREIAAAAEPPSLLEYPPPGALDRWRGAPPSPR